MCGVFRIKTCIISTVHACFPSFITYICTAWIMMWCMCVLYVGQMLLRELNFSCQSETAVAKLTATVIVCFDFKLWTLIIFSETGAPVDATTEPSIGSVPECPSEGKNEANLSKRDLFEGGTLFVNRVKLWDVSVQYIVCCGNVSILSFPFQHVGKICGWSTFSLIATWNEVMNKQK